MRRHLSLQPAGRAAAAAFLLALAVVACGEGPVATGAAGPIKLDKFCSLAGLTAAGRHTVVVIDTNSINRAKPEEFRTRNPALFALATGLADPEKAVESGATAPRERLTFLAGRADAGSLVPIFTGCVPGISPEELSARANAGSDGAVDKYFGSDMASEVTEARDEFRRQLLVSLMSLERLASTNAASEPTASPLVGLLKALGQPPAAETGVRRLFVFTDLQSSLPAELTDISAARAAGFAAAEANGLRLGMVEAFLVPSRDRPSAGEQAYLTTMMLGSQADLKGVGDFTPNGLSPAPTQIVNYRGELPVGSGINLPLNIRLASGPSGELVNSWISYSGSMGQRATPLSGRFECAADRRCELKSDPAGGLGQLWRTAAGTDPQPMPSGPFGGLRFIEGSETTRSFKGRIFDPAIFLAPSGDMKFEAKRDT